MTIPIKHGNSPNKTQIVYYNDIKSIFLQLLQPKRLSAIIVRRAPLHLGTIMELVLVNGNIVVMPIGQHKLTLDERLQAFDPSCDGGEVMATTLLGAEKFELPKNPGS